MDENLVKAAKNARNQYARAWRAKNKERVRANNLRYWARRAEREAAEAAEQEAKHERDKP